jgi:hypothetical protein
MKRLVRPIIATTNSFDNECIFTSKDVIDILSKIQQLRNCDIAFSENPNGTLNLTVDGTVYQL